MAARVGEYAQRKPIPGAAGKPGPQSRVGRPQVRDWWVMRFDLNPTLLVKAVAARTTPWPEPRLHSVLVGYRYPRNFRLPSLLAPSTRDATCGASLMPGAWVNSL